MLTAQKLTKVYQSGGRPLTVLREVTLAVEAGGFLAVIGPSGCGKTTLLGLLAGLDVPTSGTVALDGEDLGALSEDARARLRGAKVGFVFQTFQLIPTLTAQENVHVPMELRGHQFPDAQTPRAEGQVPDAKTPRDRSQGPDAKGPGEAIDDDPIERAKELLARVGLEGREHHYPAQLSGGEQQRVAIARAFANRPRILFADEPTGNLDLATGGRVVALLEELNRESGTTLVMVTHDPALAGRARRTIHLLDGAVVSDSGAAA
jgi:putative ABC transport system ATP-binding protein